MIFNILKNTQKNKILRFNGRGKPTPLQIFLQFIITAYKLQTPNLAYKHFAGFAKCSKSPTFLAPLPKGAGLRQAKPLSIPLCSAIISTLKSFPFDCRKTEGSLLQTLLSLLRYTSNSQQLNYGLQSQR